MRPLALASALVCLAMSAEARASGVGYPAGAYARIAGERSLVVWDLKARREHLVQKAWFEGDGKAIVLFVPTPSAPQVAKVKDGVIDRVAALVDGDALPVPEAPAGGADVMLRVRVDEIEISSLTPGAMSSWLAANALAPDRALIAWADGYPQSWSITAVRFTPRGDPARRVIEAPTLRFSFATDTPVYPYSEPAADKSAEVAFYKHYGSGCVSGDPLCLSNQGRLLTRPFDCVVVAPEQMQSVANEHVLGPALVSAVLVPSDALAAAFDDAPPWDFDPGKQESWAITHAAEQRMDRRASVDVTFARFELPPPRPLVGAVARAPVVEARPISTPHGRKSRHGAEVAIALFLVACVVTAVLLERDRARRS